MTMPEGARTMGDATLVDNWTVGADSLLMEIMETETRKVFLCQQPVTPAQYRDLAPPEGFVKSGLGRSVADVAYFRRSPGAPYDGPLEMIDVDGMRFGFVARPGRPETDFDGVVVLPVYKYHCMFFAAGRTIEIADFGDGWDYLPQVSSSSTGAGEDHGEGRRDGQTRERELPEGWSIRSVTLAQDLVAEIPYPARVCFLRDGSSFHGPLRLGPTNGSETS